MAESFTQIRAVFWSEAKDAYTNCSGLAITTDKENPALAQGWQLKHNHLIF